MHQNKPAAFPKTKIKFYTNVIFTERGIALNVYLSITLVVTVLLYLKTDYLKTTSSNYNISKQSYINTRFFNQNNLSISTK